MEGSRFIDADGHVLEPPTGMLEHAPRRFRDRIWHIESDPKGTEWLLYDGRRSPANTLAIAGTAGMSPEDFERARDGKLRYTEVVPAAWDAKARLQAMERDGIDVSVLYPTMLLGIAGHPDVEFAEVQCRAYNDWLSAHVVEAPGRLHGVGILPQQDVERAAAEIRRVGKLPGMVAVLVRPNPTADWRPFHDPVYEPLWRAAAEAGLAVGLHPFQSADLPGACQGMHIHRAGRSGTGRPMEAEGTTINVDNLYYTQAISNPVDMMATLTFLLVGGVCERHPELRFVFLESNGGWIVPWLERLDHHYEVPLYRWEVPWLRMPPSEYFKRQCWISFDADESTLAFTARSPLCGAERIVWASDFPHPDAKYPGTTEELREALAPLDSARQRRIASENAAELYRL